MTRSTPEKGDERQDPDRAEIKNVSASELMLAAFAIAKQQHSATAKAWVRVSFLIGGLLPNSLLAVSIQRIGELDVLLRHMEDESQADMKRVQDNMWILSLQVMLSEVWVCELYEVFRLLQARKLVVGNDVSDSLANDLRALRVTISKYEIAADRKLQGPLLMKAAGADDADAYEYRPGDPKRAHIMQTGLTARGSVVWQAVDGASINSPRSLERRSLSERTLQLWSENNQPALG